MKIPRFISKPLTQLRKGDRVKVAFSYSHKKEYPSYTALYDGQTGRVLGGERCGFVSLEFSSRPPSCIEREFLVRIS